MKCIKILLLLLVFVSCKQRDPHPELGDVIYKDILVELDIAKKELESEEKNLISLEKEKALAVPQTGQIKFAGKKVSDSLEKINILKQRVQFFEIKTEQRIQYAKEKYEESLRAGGKPWPDPDEITQYKSIIKLQRDKIDWDRSKGIKKPVPRGTDAKK